MVIEKYGGKFIGPIGVYGGMLVFAKRIHSRSTLFYVTVDSGADREVMESGVPYHGLVEAKPGICWSIGRMRSFLNVPEDVVAELFAEIL
jgi:hypothetical protein